MAPSYLEVGASGKPGAVQIEGKMACLSTRLWRTIKYEEVYLRAYANVPDARASLGRYIDHFYNARRPHSSLDRQTPDESTSNALSSIPMVA